MAKHMSATARLADSDCHSTVEVRVPAGTQFDDLVRNPEILVDVFSKFRPQGCQVCLSGRDFLIREMFDDVINVELRG